MHVMRREGWAPKGCGLVTFASARARSGRPPTHDRADGCPTTRENEREAAVAVVAAAAAVGTAAAAEEAAGMAAAAAAAAARRGRGAR